MSTNIDNINRYANEGSALWTNADLERALAADAEAKRQFELNLAWQKEQAAIANDQWERQFALQQRAASSGGSRSSGSSSSSQNDTFDYLVGLFDQNNPYNNYNSYIGSGANTNPVYNTKNWMAQTLSDNAGSLTPEQYRALVTTYGLSEYI